MVTSLEFERIMNAAGPTKGQLVRPSDGKHPHEIVFIQCVGSRGSEDAGPGRPYCSKVCCMFPAKHAMGAMALTGLANRQMKAEVAARCKAQ